MTARLDWQAFSTHFFPQRARHDLQVLKAHEVYRNGLAAERRDLPGEPEAVQVWEQEGGAAR